MASIQLPGKTSPLLLGIVCSFLFAWTQFANTPFLNSLTQRAESLIYDLRFNQTLVKNRSPDPRIVIVDIDERSLGIEGR